MIKAGQVVRVRKGYEGEGKTGVALALFPQYNSALGDIDLGQDWVAVKFDDEEDPDLFKEAGLEIIPEKERRWPRPWHRPGAGFVVVDAKGNEVMHFGGVNGPGLNDGAVLSDLVELIVSAVNALPRSQDKKR